MAAKRLKLTSTDADAAAVNAAIQALDAGRIVVVPMETVYAAVARADDQSALAELRKLRSMPASQALALHVGAPDDAADYLDPPDRHLRQLMKRLWPGPVGIVFEVSAARQDEVAKQKSFRRADLFDGGQITIRCPAHHVALEVLRGCRHPVVAVPAGDSADRPDSLAQTVLERAHVVLDDGPVKHGKPSTIIRAQDHEFEIVRAGVYDRRIIEKMLRTTILFVCSGNTCRSPMAQAIARKVLADSLGIPERDLEKRGYEVISAGTGAAFGMPATSHAVEAVREFGADLSSHRSRPLTQQLVSQATVIFAMSRSHAHTISLADPSAMEKTVLLDTDQDIEDPIGGELGLYKNLAAKIKEIVERRLADGSLLGMEKSK